MAEEKCTNTFKQKIDGTDAVGCSFNPADVRIGTTNATVEQLVLQIRNGKIYWTSTVGQSAAWRSEHQSCLIESLLLRIPISVFYVAEDENNNWSVIDGVRRLSAIYNYVTGDFPLDRLEYFAQLNGKRYSALPRRMQRRINETQVILHIVDMGTPEDVTLNIARRINPSSTLK